MVMLPEGYCIDRTEVTQGQYAAWLEGAPSTGGQLQECEWNTSYEPLCDWFGPSRYDFPVVCVDWCDAYAYCEGVGKHLCGSRAGCGDGWNPMDPDESQWYNACVSGAANHLFPYGDVYDTDACNGGDHSVGRTVEVATMAECRSSVQGYEGVYDLTGNVWEWEDLCAAIPGQSELCSIRGGSWGEFEDDAGCARTDFARRDEQAGTIGFRCCAP